MPKGIWIIVIYAIKSTGGIVPGLLRFQFFWKLQIAEP